MTIELLNLTEEEYRKMPGVNWSSLKHMEISPAQHKWEVDHPKEATAAMSLGTIEHLALLTPDEYFKRRNIIEGASRGTKKFESLMGSRELITVTSDENEMILLHLERYQSNIHYEQITENGHVEQCLKWADDETGLICKCRPDLYNESVLVDLKTTRHIDDKHWWWDFYDKRYHCQFAFYYDALRQLDDIDRVCVVVKLETSPCFDVVYYPIPDQAIIEGRAHYRGLLRRLRECVDTDSWPGKSNELASCSFHNWTL